MKTLGRFLRIVTFTFTAVFAAALSWADSVELITNGSFEGGDTTKLHATDKRASFASLPGGWAGKSSGWALPGTWYQDPPGPKDGTAAAYMQMGSSVISQEVTVVGAGLYRAQFYAVARSSTQNGLNLLAKIDPGTTNEVTVVPATTITDASAWTLLSGDVFLQPGKHVFAIFGQQADNKDRCAAVDCVSLVPVVSVTLTNSLGEAVLSLDGGNTWFAGTNGWFGLGSELRVTVRKDVRQEMAFFGAPVTLDLDETVLIPVSGQMTVRAVRAYIWDGVGGRWDDLGHWKLGRAAATALPGATDDVIIPSGDADYTVYATNAISVGSLAIGSVDGTAVGKATFESRTLETNRVSGSLHVYKNGRMTHAAHEKKVNTPKYKLNFEVGADMTIDASGEVNVDTKGYYSMCGQGQSASGVWYAGCPSGSTSTALIYGSISEPTDLGSGGHSNGYDESTKSGGGAVYLDVAGTLTVNGTICASANEHSGGNGGICGSGGSILIKCGTLSGSSAGAIRADYTFPSANGSNWSGPGGRVAVYQRTATDWSGFAGKITSLGSSNTDCPGGPGTVFQKLPSQQYGDLTVEGRNTDKSGWCAITTNVVDHDRTFDSVTLKNKARLRLGKDVTLKVVSKLDVSGGTLVGADPSATLEFVGEEDCTCAFSATFDVKKVTCTVPGKRLKFSPASTKMLVMPDYGLLTLRGSAEKPLELYPATDNTTWYLKLNPNTTQDVYSVAVTNSDARAGEGVLAVDSVNLGGNFFWSFIDPPQPGQLNQWKGTKSTAWADGGNWSRGYAPMETDRVLIPKITTEPIRYPLLDKGAKILNELYVNDGATMSMSGASLTVTNKIVVAGSFFLTSRATLAFSGNADFTGGSFSCNDARLRLIGDGNQTFKPGGVSLDYLIVAKSGGLVTFSSGFTANDWRVDAGAPLALLFAPGASVTAHTMYLNGFTPGATNLALRGSVPGSAWSLRTDPLRQSVTGVCVRDCAAPSDAPVRADGRTCADEGNNANWLFGSAVSRWAGGEGSFSDASKWIPSEVPGSGSHVAIVAGEGAPATVTLAAGEAVPLASLTMSGADGALAKFTANAPIAVAGDLEVLTNATLVLNSCDEFNTVDGDVRLYAGATLMHDGPQKTMTKRLRLQIAGDMTVDAGALVDADCKGYTGTYLPDGTTSSSGGGTHGGVGQGGRPGLCYDSVSMPVMYGAGGGGGERHGGGAIYFDVTGTLTVNGVVTACGNSTFNGNGGCGGAGGSILLACGTLAGGGIVRADHATADIYDKYSPSYSGGGGRISLIQREAKDWTAFTGKAWARGGKNSTCGSAGTVYRLCAGSPYGEVRVDNGYDSTDRSNGSYATLPSTNPDTKEVTRGFALTIGGGGKVKITQNWTIYDLSFFNNKATLALGTNTLTLISREHKDGKGWPSGISITSNQAPNGVWGKIVWKKPGFALIVR